MAASMNIVYTVRRVCFEIRDSDSKSITIGRIIIMTESKMKVSQNRAPNPAFMKPVKPSEALAKIVGNESLPRTEITKKLWEYVKKHNLQDPNNKRNINADENLLPVFDGKNQVSMFEMTKLVNKHLS
jgi:chromatin remodeling complex protein RSC6